jgi:hypothetical protein
MVVVVVGDAYCCTYDVVKSMPLNSYPDPFRFFWSNVDRMMNVQLQRLCGFIQKERGKKLNDGSALMGTVLD